MDRQIIHTQKHKQMARSLPLDIIVEILSWMSMKPLTRLKCVSKPWLNLINRPDFIKLQHERSNELLLVFVNNSFNSLKSLELSHILDDDDDDDDRIRSREPHLTEHRLDICGNFVILGSSNGFLCIGDPSMGGKLVLYNPVTRTEKLLPPLNPDGPGPSHYTAFGFGYDFMSDDYKVVLISQMIAVNYHGPKRDQLFNRVAIYSLKADRWVKSCHECATSFRFINFLGFPSPPLYCGISNFVNNALHWLTASGTEFESTITCFGLCTEQFYKISLPTFRKRMRLGRRMLELAVLRGRLHLLVDDVSLWVMKEYGVKESWTKLYNLSSRGWSVRPITYWKAGSEMLFEEEAPEGELGRKVLFSLDLKKKTIKDLGVCLDCYRVGCYEKTLAN